MNRAMSDERALLHELHNMLAVMLGYSEIVDVSVLDPSVRDDLIAMKEAGERAMAIVRKLQVLRSS
jgi:signal transduction histidine kinase